MGCPRYADTRLKPSKLWGVETPPPLGLIPEPMLSHTTAGGHTPRSSCLRHGGRPSLPTHPPRPCVCNTEMNTSLVYTLKISFRTVFFFFFSPRTKGGRHTRTHAATECGVGKGLTLRPRTARAHRSAFTLLGQQSRFGG